MTKDLIGVDESLKGGQKKLSEEDSKQFALLPKRLVTYALWERKFVQVDSRHVKRMRESDNRRNPFDQLEIEPRYRKLIQSIVSEHFQLKEVEERNPHGGAISQDIIGNKGKGVIILPHGVPGVGKTATTEAVA